MARGKHSRALRSLGRSARPWRGRASEQKHVQRFKDQQRRPRRRRVEEAVEDERSAEEDWPAFDEIEEEAEEEETVEDELPAVARRGR